VLTKHVLLTLIYIIPQIFHSSTAYKANVYRLDRIDHVFSVL